MGCCIIKRCQDSRPLFEKDQVNKDFGVPRTMHSLSPTKIRHKYNTQLTIPHATQQLNVSTDCVLSGTEHSTNGLTISAKETKSAPKLRLTIIESLTLSSHTSFLINACGFPLSKRKANDGCVYIGTKGPNVETGEILNDIVFPKEEHGMGDRHLLIKYSVETKSYYVKDTGEGTGTFIRIDKSVVLQHGFVISYGDCHMFVIILPNNELQLKFLDGPRTDQTFKFSPRETLIKIGRISDCDIQLESKMLSRYQCGLYYGKSGWVIVDGDGTKPSKNGTWLFADELFLIYDGMMFKAGQTLFQANILSSKKT